MKEEKQGRSIGNKALRSMMFPLMMGVLKLAGESIVSTSSGEIGPLETYLILSGMADLGEVFVRTYIFDELGGFTKKPLEGEPCSFLERHLAYDIPKYTIDKIRKKLKKQ